MNSDDHMRKVRFRDDDGNVECLWAEHLGDDTYQLDNSPWFAYGVSWKDVVRAIPTIEGDNMPDFQEIVRKSGHRTIRLILEDDSTRQERLEGLLRLGCTYEGSNGSYFGIDIPPAADFKTVCEYLTSMNEEWEHADPTYHDLYLEKTEAQQDVPPNA